MTNLIKNIESLLSLDWQTLAVIAVLCAFAAYFIKEYLANPPMIIFVYPLFVFFSILAQYFFIVMETYPPKKLDQWLMWTIMSAIIGTITGTGLVACLVAVRERVGSRPS
jgi:vacuolar-type H+-ATPase subunit I/STV1